jgi:hypothetical protein
VFGEASLGLSRTSGRRPEEYWWKTFFVVFVSEGRPAPYVHR